MPVIYVIMFHLIDETKSTPINSRICINYADIGELCRIGIKGSFFFLCMWWAPKSGSNDVAIPDSSARKHPFNATPGLYSLLCFLLTRIVLLLQRQKAATSFISRIGFSWFFLYCWTTGSMGISVCISVWIRGGSETPSVSRHSEATGPDAHFMRPVETPYIYNQEDSCLVHVKQ